MRRRLPVLAGRMPRLGGCGRRRRTFRLVAGSVGAGSAERTPAAWASGAIEAATAGSTRTIEATALRAVGRSAATAVARSAALRAVAVRLSRPEATALRAVARSAATAVARPAALRSIAVRLSRPEAAALRAVARCAAAAVARPAALRPIAVRLSRPEATALRAVGRSAAAAVARPAALRPITIRLSRPEVAALTAGLARGPLAHRLISTAARWAPRLVPSARGHICTAITGSAHLVATDRAVGRVGRGPEGLRRVGSSPRHVVTATGRVIAALRPVAVVHLRAARGFARQVRRLLVAALAGLERLLLELLARVLVLATWPPVARAALLQHRVARRRLSFRTGAP